MKQFESISVRFQNQQDILLAAKLDLPATPRYFAIFSPCFTCTKETLATYRISQQLAKKNIAVLRLDFTGLGESHGNFAESNFSTMVTDILSANKFLSDQYEPAKMLLGHSMGGTASYSAGLQLNNIKTIVSIASPSTPSHVLHHFDDALNSIRAGKEAEFFVAGKAYPVTPQFLLDLEQHNLPDKIHQLNKAILIFHGEHDNVVPSDNAEKIYQAARQPKSIISLDSADHILSERNDSTYVAELIDSWATRYI